MNSRLPLADVSKLIAQDLNEIEIQYKEKIEFYLGNRIHSRALIAGSVGQEFEVAISVKANVGIKGTAKVLEKSVLAIALPWLAMEIGVAVGISFTAGGLAAVGLAGAVAGGVLFARTRYRNKIRTKAKIYQQFFPREKSIIELFSQLVTLSVIEALNDIKTQPAEAESMGSSIKKTLHNAWKLAYGTNIEVKEDDKQQQIKILSKTEFQRIWEIFKLFTRQPEKYAAFAESAKAQEMLALFERNCHLGDAQDKKKVINDWKINVFWLTIFAYYLEEKGEKVYASVVSSLTDKLSAVVVQQAISSITEVSILKDQISVLQDQLSVLQKWVWQVSNNMSSAVSGSQDSLVSEKSATESALGVSNASLPFLFWQNTAAHAQSTAREGLHFTARCA